MALTPKQQRFCEEYLRDLNATQACIRAGYSAKTAGTMGWENLRKPEIRQHIDSKLSELSLSASETLKSISDIARSNLNEYFIERTVSRTPQIKITVKEYIKRLRQQMEDAQKLFDRTNEGTKEEKDIHEAAQKRRTKEIVEQEIILERNPKATMIINGETELITIVDLDLARLVKDKEAGKIKSISFTEFGPKVELYAADAALNTLAKYHGLFEKDNKQKAPEININGLNKDDLKALLDIKNKL